MKLEKLLTTISNISVDDLESLTYEELDNWMKLISSHQVILLENEQTPEEAEQFDILDNVYSKMNKHIEDIWQFAYKSGDASNIEKLTAKMIR
jgi:hypothetical protein